MKADDFVARWQASIEPMVPPDEIIPALQARGWFRCYSCDHWYDAENHYRGECCLGCGDPCDDSWPDGAPEGWWTDPAVVAAHRAAIEDAGDVLAEAGGEDGNDGD